MSLTLRNTTRTSPPRHPYEAMTNTILGRSYDVTLVFVGRTRARALNTTYRKKTYIPNVLSFPLDAKTGEIYICLHIAKQEAPKFDMTYTQYVAYLLIHGALHLKGYGHGATMDKLERKHLTAFGITKQLV